MKQKKFEFLHGKRANKAKNGIFHVKKVFLKLPDLGNTFSYDNKEEKNDKRVILYISFCIIICNYKDSLL